MKKPSGPLIGVISVIVSVVAAELFLAHFFPYPDPFAGEKRTMKVSYVPSYFPPHFRMKFEIEDGLPGVKKGEVSFSVNNMGFRGDEISDSKPPGEFRIFMVGGSTTECRLVDDSDEPGRGLQNLLNAKFGGTPDIKVYNSGKSGDKSFDHIAMIGHRIVHLEPDLIILLAGINDLIAAANGTDYLHLTEVDSQELDLGSLLKYAATDFQIGRRVFRLVNKFSHQTGQQMFQEISKQTNFRRRSQSRMAKPVSSDPPRTDLVHYRNNLLTIVGMARAHRIPIILMTQATTWNSKVDPEAEKWHWMGLAFDEQTYREDFLDDAMESYNDVVRQVGAQDQVPVLDLARSIPKSLEFFYDDCHFNLKGAQQVASLLSDLIVQRDLIHPPADFKKDAGRGPVTR